MATKHDEFKVYYFSFDENELGSIVESLLADGNEGLAEAILEEMSGKCDDCERDTSDSIASLEIDIDYSAATEARDEIDKLTCAVESLAEAYRELNEAQCGPVEYSLGVADKIINEIYAASKNGRVITAGAF